jgi:hypothetical protein
MDDVTPIDRTASVDYDSDFYAWALDQAARVRASDVPGLDAENVAEEIESLGRSQKHELLSRCTVLLMHLLKWRFQPERRGASWQSTIAEQRMRVAVILRDSPSLRRTVPDVVLEAFGDARELAAIETGLGIAIFPPACPWLPAEILQKAWLPD